MDYDERSPLWGIGATVAIGSGLGTSIYRGRQELMDALRVPNKDVASEVGILAQQTKGFNSKQLKAGVDVLDEGFAGAMTYAKDKATKNYLRNDIASATYESILSGRRVDKGQAYTVFQNVLKQKDPVAAYREASAAVISMGGDTNVLSSRLKMFKNGKYPEGRMAEMSKVARSSGLGENRLGTEFAALGPEVEARGRKIQKRIWAAAGDKVPVKFTGLYQIDDIINGKEVKTPMMTGRIGGTNVNIPLADTGLTYTGENLTARYILRQSHDQVGKSKHYADRYVDMLEEILSKNNSNMKINMGIHSAHSTLVENIMKESSSFSSQAMYTMPEEVLTSGGLAKQRLNRLQSVATEAGNLDIADIEALKKAGLAPIGSPDAVGKGTMFRNVERAGESLDIAEDIYGPSGRLFPIEKRPLQGVRSEWGVTAEAKQAATPFKGTFGEYYSRLDRKIQGPGYKEIMYGGQDVMSAQAYSSPQLLTAYAKTAEDGGFGFKRAALNEAMFADEMVLNKSVANMFQQEQMIPHKISLAADMPINENILASLEKAELGKVVTLPEPVGTNRFIGIDLESGKEFWDEASTASKGEIVKAQITGINEATVFERRVASMTEDEYVKVFSEEAKGLAKVRGDREFGKALGAAGAELNVAGQSVEALAGSKMLQKNPMALLHQQVEMMSMFSAQKMGAGTLDETAALAAKSLLQDPEKALNFQSLKDKDLGTALTQINKNMLTAADKMNFSTKEMQMTFGLMEEGTLTSVLGAERAAEVASADVVYGLSKAKMGSLASDGIGKYATMEHTGFRALAMKGEEGRLMAVDLASRLQGKGEFEATDRVMRSLVNKRDIIDEAKGFFGQGGIPTDKIAFADLGPEDLIKEEGRYVNIGQNVKSYRGANKMYIPGFAEAEELTIGTMQKGVPVESEYARNLRKFQTAVQSGAADDIELAATNLRNVAHQAYESQASAHGKAYGSRFLKGISQQKTDDVFRISKETGQEMFDELIERATDRDQVKFLKAEKTALMEGKTLQGGVWRHPTTGTESFQFANYKIDPKLKGPMISAPMDIGTLKYGDEAKGIAIDLSQMSGMKGDFDGDNFAISVISEKRAAESARKSLQGRTQAKYTEYLFNHFGIKKALGDPSSTKIMDMNRLEAYQTGAKRLTEAKISTGQVNLALQKAKIGLAYSAPKEYDALGELFWNLEETAIGGKHGTIDKVMGGELYQNMAKAINNRDAKSMETILTNLGGEARDIDMNITDSAGKVIPGQARWDPKRSSEVMMESISGVSDDVESAFASQRVARGKENIKDVNKIVEMMYRRKAGSIDAAQTLMQEGAGRFSGVSRKANSILRRGASKFSSVKSILGKAKGPALIGAAGAAAIMMLAPSTSGSIKAEGSRGGRGFGDDDLGPPSGPGINPPEPRIMNSPRTYDIGGMRQASRANIRMSYKDAESHSGGFMRYANSLNGNVRVRTVDDRSSLDSHRLANKIHERL